MIIIMSKNEMTKAEVNKEILQAYRNWFISNPEQWFIGRSLYLLIGLGNENPRNIINKLRNEGLPIISSKNGYKLTTNKKEIEQCYKKLRIRAIRSLTACKQMKKQLL